MREQQGISAVGKALAVFETFQRSSTSLSLTQIAHRTGLPLSTTHRIVNELSEWGALERTSDGFWHIGFRLWEVTTLCPRGHQLRELALPFMQDLYEVGHANVQLAVREGADHVITERITGRHSVELKTTVGSRFPLPATALGMVLLAHAPRATQDEVLTGPLVEFTTNTVVDPQVLRAMLAHIRRSQCAVSVRQVTRNTVGLAVPIRNGAKGEVHAALGAVVQGDSSAAISSLRIPLMTAARAISAQLDRGTEAIAG